MIIHLSKDCLRRLAITGWPSILMVIVIYCVAFINIPPPPPRIPNYLILFLKLIIYRGGNTGSAVCQGALFMSSIVCKTFCEYRFNLNTTQFVFNSFSFMVYLIKLVTNLCLKGLHFASRSC